jgi:hypothetical protein
MLGYLHGLEFLKPCFFGDLVLPLIGIAFQVTYIGDVADVPYLIAQVPEISEEQIESYGWPGMSQMGFSVNGGSANIQAHIGWVEGLKLLFFPVQGVVNI